MDSDEAAEGQVRSTVIAAGSSFLWAMRLMPRAKREAMYAVYAYCRTIDDIADGEAPAAEKIKELGAWKDEIDRLYSGNPNHAITRALAGPVRTYGLAKEDFMALLDGMEMDAANRMVAPSMEELELYCARVAGAVGLLSVRIFSVPDPEGRTLALTLGQALQFTNLLRDLSEDAALGRLYLPRVLLEAHGIAETTPDAVLKHPALPKVCDDIAAMARQSFDDAGRALARSPRAAVRPARVMMKVYQRLLERLVLRDWTRIEDRIRLSSLEKLWIALRYGLC
ncbi:MAG: presqualene diphosphate synthase HpnD [Alphaproteobacteria bacterium]